MKQRGLAFKFSVITMFLLAVVLTGCAKNNTASNTGAAATTEPSAASTPAGSEAPVTTEPAAKKPTVAFVYIGPPGDGGYTYQHDQGRLYMEKELGIKADFVENVPESADAERIITELAQKP
ncbi:hypothetical protein ACFSQ7_41660 [Paenibacillus rhizoplanae]